jgi:hypothetical protein
MSNRLFRRRIAAWATFGLVAASLVAITPAANANGTSGPVGPSDFSFSRESTDGFSFVVKPGESAGLQSSTNVIDTWSGWPLPRNTVLSRNALKVTTLPADVEQYDWDYRSWQLYNFDPESQAECDFYEETNTVKMTTEMTCARNLWVSDTITVENNSPTTKTVSTNAASLKVKYGKKTIGVSDSRIDRAVANISITGEDSAVITPSEDNVGLGFNVCLAEETLSANDTLTVHPVVTFNDVALSETAYNVYGWGEDVTVDGGWDGDLTVVTEPDSLSVEYTVPEPEDGEELENLVVELGIYPVNTDPGEYAGSVDVKLNGTSVTEPCPSYNLDWPTLDSVNGSVTIAEGSLPNATFTSNENFDQYSSQPDGFGGMFYYGFEGDDWDDNPNSDVSVVHLDGNTPSNSLAGVGEIVLNSGRYGYVDIARFGENGDNWYALAAGNKGAYTFTSGTMDGTAIATHTFTSRTLNGLCGRGFAADWVSTISAPTVSPLLDVSCFNKSIGKSVLAKVVGGAVSVVATLGTGTKSRPCVVNSYGRDTRASGTEAAAVFYTRVSSKDDNGYCGARGATIISSRSITTVTAALSGTPVRTVLAANPWGDRDEPVYIEIAAATTQGEWFGVSYESSDLMYSPATPAQLFEMNGLGIDAVADITLDPSMDFGDWSLLSPLSQVSSTEWKLMFSGSAEFDGENVSRATVATIDDNGVVTNGDVLEASGMGYSSGRVINRFSSDSEGNARFYSVTGVDTYTSAAWDFR